VKVALTHPYSWPEVRRGAERIVVDTGRALAARGHDVTIFTASSHTGREWNRGVRVVTFRRVFRNPHRHERWFGWRVLPNLVVGRFDVVHSFMPYDALAAVRARRLTGNRTVYDEMGIPLPSWWASQPNRKVRTRLVAEVDVYGCMSGHARAALERECGRTGALIPGGVRLSEFRPAPAREQRPTLLFSGKIDEPRKGVAVLLRALALLSEWQPDVQLWLSGPGDAGPLLDAAPPAARRRTEVLPIGEPSSQGERYARAWVTVLPSIADSFGLVLLESLACGTPIVVVKDAAPPELVSPRTGAVAEPADPQSLADAIRAALDLARRRETIRACREFARRFDWDEGIAPLLERLYADEAPQSASLR
jgi:phosphatidyl-myo-inositol alpha-mannosyltransferase